jgi:hypothetical protein
MRKSLLTKYPGINDPITYVLQYINAYPAEYVAFVTHVAVSATALTRDEFIAQQQQEALRLRSGILADNSATAALKLLAVDADAWTQSYFSALETAGLLRAVDAAPVIRSRTLVASMLSTLATGVLLGNAGQKLVSTGDLVDFFSNVRKWYGEDTKLAIDPELDPQVVNLPAPNFNQFDLNATAPTHTQGISVYGELVEGAFTGLLGTAGNGRVSYQIQAKQSLTTGTEISTQARVFFNNAAPVDTQIITNTIDAVAPTSQVTASPLVVGSSDYLVKWTVTDDPSGAGVKGTSVYVSDNGGEFKVWQSQTTATEGVFKGIAGHSYEFLSLALDNAGNIENQQLKLRDLSARLNTNNGDITVTGGGTPPVVVDLPTNSLFTQAQLSIPARVSNNPSGFQAVVKPFVASSLVKDLPISYGEVGGLAVLPVADGKVLVSGGTNRGDLYSNPI